LTADPEDRFDADEALRSEWFTHQREEIYE